MIRKIYRVKIFKYGSRIVKFKIPISKLEQGKIHKNYKFRKKREIKTQIKQMQKQKQKQKQNRTQKQKQNQTQKQKKS